jgi:hypothetical protein
VTDQVDDIEAAEDLLGSAHHALEALLEVIEEVQSGNASIYETGTDSVVLTARSVVEQIDTYCRPTCGFLEQGACDDDPDFCGCPCGHGGRAGSRPMEDVHVTGGLL